MNAVSDKIKILHIIKSLGRGGAEMLLPETLKLHDQSRFEFHYIYFLPWKNQLAEAIEKQGGIVRCLSASNNLMIILKTLEIIRYVKSNHIQLIHCHLPWAGIVGRLVYKLTKVPVIYTEHNKQERYHRLTRWMNRWTFNWQHMSVAVSGDVAASINNNIAPVIPVRTVLNGVNTDAFIREPQTGRQLRKELGIPEDAVVIGTVAVFRFQKRLKEWLEVFAVVAKENPNVYGILIGDGPLREEIVARRAELGLTEKVIMTGLQTDVKPWYSAMDVFMMTSVFEGLPIALLEAMSMACAIATTDAGGIKEVIRHEQDGLLVKVEEWRQLSKALNILVEDKDLRYRLSSAARLRVETHFSLKRMVGEVEELYYLTAEAQRAQS